MKRKTIRVLRCPWERIVRKGVGMRVHVVRWSFVLVDMVDTHGYAAATGGFCYAPWEVTRRSDFL